MKRRDGFVIGAIFAAAVILALVGLALRSGGGEVRVWLDGELYAVLPLHEDGELVIEQANGAVNIVEVSAGRVRMKQSTCPTQTCVACGWRDADDAALLPDAGWIICLPNRVSVEVAK